MSSEALPPHKTVETPLNAELAGEVKDILDALKGLQFGSVHVTVQDGVIIQIDRTEKRRIRKSSRS